MAPRWRKAVRDLAARPGRSVLTVLAMAAGLFEIGTMLYAYALLRPALGTFYERTHPSSATLTLDRASDALVDSVRRVPGVAAVEHRPVILARARVGKDEWVPVILYAVRDFDAQALDTFTPDRGAWPPPDADIALERTALQVAHAELGDSLTLRLEGGEERAVRIASTVHAAGLPPAWMEHMVPGFVAWGSPLRGDAHGESEQLRIRVADHPLDEGYIREVVDSVRVMLERQGHTVGRVTVPPPGRHPHAGQMEAFLLLILAFGILSFALSAVLVAAIVHGLMSEQLREVGVMKAIGASDRQIAGLYLGQVALLALGGLALGLPLGLMAGGAYARFSATMLNADITHAAFPTWVVLAEVGIGLLLPLVVSLGPVLRASRITVRAALDDAPAAASFGASALERWLVRTGAGSRPLLWSLRTTLQRRGRLALTVAMLAVGGAAFISALNVAEAWRHSVDADFARRHYDLAVGLASPARIDTVSAVLAAVPEVVRAEYWQTASPYLINAHGVPGNTVSWIGLDPASGLLELRLLEGRWLRPGDTDGAVVNRALLQLNPTLRLSGRLQLRLKGRTIELPIVGVVRELAPMPAVYSTRGTVLDAVGQSGTLTRSVEIVTRRHDAAGQRDAAGAVERAFAAHGLELTGLQRLTDAKKGILDHIVIILSILTVASLLVVLVGGLGLTSALTLSVVQRTREIGVLAAVGATPWGVGRIVWIEALAIGVLSWAVANVVAIPISAGLESATGMIFLRAPIDFRLSPQAAAAWLGLVLVLASLSSVYPARRAARLTVREALGRA